MSIIKALKLSGGKLKEQVSGDTVGPITTASGTITRGAGVASGTQVITIGFQPSVVLFAAYVTADTQVISDGWDNGTISQCTWSNHILLLSSIISATSKSTTQSIQVQNSSNVGHSANISATSSTGFTLNWTQLGAGLAITVNYIAIY